MQKRLLRLLPWLVTAGLLFLLFRRISFVSVWQAARQRAGLDGARRAGSVALVYLADSFAIWKTFGWFLTRMSFTDVLLVRGATYLLAAINYNVGQGAIVYFVHKQRRHDDHARRRHDPAGAGHQRAGAAVPGDGRDGRGAGAAARW